MTLGGMVLAGVMLAVSFATSYCTLWAAQEREQDVQSMKRGRIRDGYCVDLTHSHCDGECVDCGLPAHSPRVSWPEGVS